MPPNNTSAASDASFLRHITIITFVPAFPLLLAHGIAAKRAFPALGLLPLAGSALLGCLILYCDRIAISGSSIQQLSQSNIFFADLLLGIALLAALITSWITLTVHSWRWDNGSLIILGTYGTVFLLTNFVVHLYFVCLQILQMLTARSCSCAHCQSVTKSGSFMRMVSEYTPLNADDDPEGDEAYTDIEAGNGTNAL